MRTDGLHPEKMTSTHGANREDKYTKGPSAVFKDRTIHKIAESPL